MRDTAPIRLNDRQRDLVEDNIGLVGYALARYGHQGVGYGEDAFQIGLIGLMRAAACFDNARGVRFATYAVHCILSELKQEHRRMTRPSRGGGMRTLSLDLPCRLAGEEDIHLADQIPCDECDIEEQLARLDLVQRMLRMLEMDKSKPARIALDYFTSTDGQRTVAKRHGVSQAYASTSIRRAARWLRKQFASQSEMAP